MTRDQDDNANQPPEVDIHDDNRQAPPPAAAAGRILEYVSWFGDGLVDGDPAGFPLFARDLEATAKAALAPKVDIARVEAAMKLLYPDEMTPTAKRVLEKILKEAS